MENKFVNFNKGFLKSREVDEDFEIKFVCSLAAVSGKGIKILISTLEVDFIHRIKPDIKIDILILF